MKILGNQLKPGDIVIQLRTPHLIKAIHPSLSKYSQWCMYDDSGWAMNFSDNTSIKVAREYMYV